MADPKKQDNQNGEKNAAEEKTVKRRSFRDSGVMSLRCDNWMYSSWNNSELHGSYMRGISNYQVLSAEEESEYIRTFSAAREQMRRMVDDFPPVIFAKLRDLAGDCERVRLANYLDIELDDNNAYSNDTIDQLDLNVINRLLAQEKEITAAILSRQQALKQAGKEGGIFDLSAELAKFLPGVGKTQLRQRFYTECVDMFVKGRWRAEGIDEAEQHRLCERMSAVSMQSVQAMNRLVEGNLRLVISIARRYTCTLMSLADLVQEGNIGLMRAVESFEYKLGNRFSTYASYWVRQAISHAINSNGRCIRMPVNILRQLSRIRHAEREFLQENGRPPSVDEVGKIIDMHPARIRALQKMSQQPISLQSVVSEDRDWGELLADDRMVMPHEEFAKENLCNSLRMALNTLEEREREILVRRFGLMGQPVETLEQIAARFHLTSERIRQIESSALRKLRTPQTNRYLDELR